MSDSIFEAPVETPEALEIDPDKDYFSELVGEDKRYKDTKAAGRAIVEKDAFITRLEAETAELRKELQKRVTLEELVDKIKTARTEQDQRPNPDGDHGRESPPAALSSEQIAELIEQQLEVRVTKERRASNALAVKQRLIEEFGKDYVSRLSARVQDLGVTSAFMEDLAQTNPKVFFELIGSKETRESPVMPPKSSMRTESFRPQVKSKNYAYYQELRRKEPTLYYTPKVQNEMFNEAKRQGEAFYQ